MKNLAPEIFRQRLLIEGFYQSQVNEQVIENYFQQITTTLNLRMYGQPIIFSPNGTGKADNQGYDAFVPLIDSGISLYIWTNSQFLSLIIYTCKGFDQTLAINFTKIFFQMSEIETQAF